MLDWMEKLSFGYLDKKKGLAQKNYKVLFK